jgi:hypothetical protein
MRLNAGDRVVGIAAFRSGLAQRGTMTENGSDAPNATPTQGTARGEAAPKATAPKSPAPKGDGRTK